MLVLEEEKRMKYNLERSFKKKHTSITVQIIHEPTFQVSRENKYESAQRH